MNDNKQVSLYDFKGHQVRVVEIDGNPWFVAVDVYFILFQRTTGVSARQYLAPDEQQVLHKVSVPAALTPLFEGPRGRIALISESGLYKTIMRSDKPQAKAFQDWVTREVLPRIRKDGMYVKGEEKIDLADDDALDRMTKLVIEGFRKKATPEKMTGVASSVPASRPDHLGTDFAEDTECHGDKDV